ncbi:MFS transporter [Halonatronum saccharophilum]|uniref:MFS transporter n=1 Tax=Halonatronum saccharophilum TaxID=150060 RepID=UPI0004B307E9|nr:MFS transporter [Halonatronum saccharophilum]
MTSKIEKKQKNNSQSIKKINYKQNFILMILGRLVSQLGTSIFSFALSLYVLDLTGSAGAFSMVLSFSIIPNVILNIFGGVFVDRNNKKKIIVGADILSGIFVLVFMSIFYLNDKNIIILIICNMLLASIQCIFNLAMNASISNIVKKEQVPKLNSVFTATGSIINIIGPILGAIAYTVLGMNVIFWLNSISFILSGISELFITFIQKKNSGEVSTIEQNYLNDFKKILIYLKKAKTVRFLLIFNSTILLIFSPMWAVVVPYITYNVINVSEIQLSIVKGSLAAGAVIGSVIISYISAETTTKLLKRIFTLVSIQAVFIILLVIPNLFLDYDPSKWITTLAFSLLLSVNGVITVVCAVPLNSYFQITVPEGLRGKFFGVMSTTTSLAAVVGMWIYGAFLETMDWYKIIVFSGVIVLTAMLYLIHNQQSDELELKYQEQEIESQGGLL